MLGDAQRICLRLLFIGSITCFLFGISVFYEPGTVLADKKTEKWRRCQEDQDCVAISTYCGGWASVNKPYEKEALRYWQDIGATKACRAMAGNLPKKPVPECIDGFCEPANVWAIG